MRHKLHKNHQHLLIAPLLKGSYCVGRVPRLKVCGVGWRDLQPGKHSKFPQPYVSPKNILPLFRKVGSLCFSLSTSLLLTATPSWSQTQPSAQDLDLSPEIIKNSPVLQRWRRQIPNVLEDIKNDPSFRTRWRIGYSQFPSTEQTGGVNVGVADIFIGKSGLTVSGEYQAVFSGKRETYGADLHYYLRPLGNYINVATVLGYRYLETNRYSTSGVNVGAKLLLVLSRKSAADISLTQTWVSPGSDEEVGLTTLSVGYAVTRNLRLSTDIQKQNARQHKDSRVGIVLEWMP
jgi:hypothetical protein